jgi:polyphosphate kinase 2 (PPK2 family)
VKEALDATGRPEAPWRVVDSSDSRRRNLAVAETLLAEIRTRAESGPPVLETPPAADPSPVPQPDALAAVDLTKKLGKEKYEEQLERWQGKLHRAADKAMEREIGTVLVFEGWDAAGKGGVIRRLCAAIHPAAYRVITVAAPSDEERAHPYLWRFGRQLPRDGHLAVFDRSWYGRVLVERVEGFASEAQWRRAYGEINTFESMMAEHGVVLAKFWLHIDRDEQLRRFEDRRKTPFKQYKITDEDWRNRERWDDYERAVNEMVARTDTEHAPWVIVPANDKRYARVHVIKTVCRLLRAAV